MNHHYGKKIWQCVGAVIGRPTTSKMLYLIVATDHAFTYYNGRFVNRPYGNNFFCRRRAGACSRRYCVHISRNQPCIYIVARVRFSSPLFPWGKRGKKSFKGVATSLKIPGTQAVWCSWCFISLPHFLPSQERLAVRSAMLHQAKTICKSDISIGCYSANLHFSSSRRW